MNQYPCCLLVQASIAEDNRGVKSHDCQPVVVGWQASVSHLLNPCYPDKTIKPCCVITVVVVNKKCNFCKLLYIEQCRNFVSLVVENLHQNEQRLLIPVKCIDKKLAAFFWDCVFPVITEYCGKVFRTGSQLARRSSKSYYSASIRSGFSSVSCILIQTLGFRTRLPGWKRSAIL